MGNPNSRKRAESSFSLSKKTMALPLRPSQQASAAPIEELILPFPKFEPWMLQNSFPRFMELDSKIREKIYLFAWDQTREDTEESRFAVVNRGLARIIPKSVNPMYQPESFKTNLRGYYILFASKQTYKEASEAVYGDAVFNIVFNLHVYESREQRGYEAGVALSLEKLPSNVKRCAKNFMVTINFPLKYEQSTSMDPRDFNTYRSPRSYWPITQQFSSVRRLAEVLAKYVAMSELKVVLGVDGQLNEDEAGFAVPFYDLPFTNWKLFVQSPRTEKRAAGKLRAVDQFWLEYLDMRVIQSREKQGRIADLKASKAKKKGRIVIGRI